jgi:hypothetical protein
VPPSELSAAVLMMRFSATPVAVMLRVCSDVSPMVSEAATWML